tara:strand:+ start:150 stop:977 length:828 start_codon:yes stop_codon:yes gene_type:complete
MASVRISITKKVWTQITTTEKQGEILHLSGETQIAYVKAPVSPSGYDESTPAIKITSKRDGYDYDGISDLDFIWAYAITADATIVNCPSEGAALSLEEPYFTGERAVNTQSFIESNVKLGLQFGITVELPIASGATKYLSFKTPPGANSVIIQNRLVSTDGGMRYTPRSGAVFNETGTGITTTNLNGQSSNTSDVTVLELDNVPSDIGIYFDIVRSADATGNQAIQGIFSGDGFERVLSKDNVFLLSFENLDNKSIYIVFSVTWFEGIPDLTPIT